jgi:phosphonate transport system permease protein
MFSYAINNFEGNVRSATVLGLIGAGGIGFEMQSAMRLFKYQEMAMIVLLTLIMVTVIDQVSGRIRARLV